MKKEKIGDKKLFKKSLREGSTFNSASSFIFAGFFQIQLFVWFYFFIPDFCFFNICRNFYGFFCWARKPPTLRRSSCGTSFLIFFFSGFYSFDVFLFKVAFFKIIFLHSFNIFFRRGCFRFKQKCSFNNDRENEKVTQAVARGGRGGARGLTDVGREG